MRIVEKKGKVIVEYNHKKEPNLTWRKVREFCQIELIKIDSSKESKEIKAIEQVIKMLQHKVDLFNQKRGRYQKMFYSIKDTDPDIDEPLYKE